MAIASKQLLAFVFATPFFLLLLPNNVHSQSDNTYFQFDKFNSTPPKDLTYERDAFVPPNSTFLRLTKTNTSGYPQPCSVGRVLYSPPVKFSDTDQQASFSTTIRFSITKANDNPADGLTFFIVPVSSTTNDGGEGYNLGIFNTMLSRSIFAVEFDTYVNHIDPKVVPHIGIDIENNQSKNVTSFEGGLDKEVIAQIKYNPITREINVQATYELDNKPILRSVSYQYNLKSLLPKAVQVGISAATGSQVQVHDVHSWHFISEMKWDPDFVQKNYIRQYVK